MRGTSRLARLLLAALMLASCRGDDEPTGTQPVSLGTASVRVTGAVTRTFTGMAAFGSAGVGGDGEFGIVMTDESSDFGVTVGGSPAGRRGAGMYQLGDIESPMYAEFLSESDIYISQSGQLTITSSSAQSVQGTVTFRGRLEFGGTGEVTVTASFNAICVPNAAITCN